MGAKQRYEHHLFTDEKQLEEAMGREGWKLRYELTVVVQNGREFTVQSEPTDITEDSLENLAKLRFRLELATRGQLGKEASFLLGHTSPVSKDDNDRGIINVGHWNVLGDQVVAFAVFPYIMEPLHV